VYCGQTATWIKMPLGTEEVGIGTGHNVFDGQPPPHSKKEHSPQFSARVCCGQTAGSIKMPLGAQVGLVPVNIVFDGDWEPKSK